MINNTFFSSPLDEVDKLAEAVNNAFGTTFRDIPSITEKIDFPLDQYTEPDGTFVVEVAVVGMGADEVKVTVKTEGGRNTLSIKAQPKELTEEEKKAIEDRNYAGGIKKIKKATKLELSRLIPSNLDIRKTTKKVENGLLTIRIPVKEEEKPIEIEVE
jgi:HSP20 family molecular chaperone IbpA